MAAASPLKKSPYMKDGWQEASTSERMNSRSLLLSSKKMKDYFNEWTTTSGALKKKYISYKNLMLQIDPLNSSY